MIIVNFSDGSSDLFFADPEVSPDTFDYHYRRMGYLSVVLERLPPNAQGQAGLLVRLQEQHKDIMRLGREEDR
ncbi:hypothetical protein FHR71_003682 [Methylobacterium sp. RAS18]|nr:hypothetical protein [Methylobacterium sp. RAS18]